MPLVDRGPRRVAHRPGAGETGGREWSRWPFGNANWGPQVGIPSLFGRSMRRPSVACFRANLRGSHPDADVPSCPATVALRTPQALRRDSGQGRRWGSVGVDNNV